MRKLFIALMGVLMLAGSFATVAAQPTRPGATPTAGETTDSGELTPIAYGLDAPATWFDERGREIASVQVTDVTLGWDEYDDYSEPDAGQQYVALTFKVENLSTRNLIVKPYDFQIVDSTGRAASYGYVSVADNSNTVIFSEDTAIAAGETVELTIVVPMYDDVDPLILKWQPDYDIYVMVLLNN